MNDYDLGTGLMKLIASASDADCDALLVAFSDDNDIGLARSCYLLCTLAEGNLVRAIKSGIGYSYRLTRSGVYEIKDK